MDYHTSVFSAGEEGGEEAMIAHAPAGESDSVVVYVTCAMKNEVIIVAHFRDFKILDEVTLAVAKLREAEL
ncbi:hypothetical protein N7448_002047 [Penicillium atrosanguineum]|uniref:Uncharacterized protein n=1 Tax=Penicillium atrosanguineum TaxID=1132637 RepID=A0A9W9LA66_9EURO|nr:hypothetical protein N7448_002047 [Penicillium atrosanguineum]KAJ5311090.1 hypothetical protein N7476_006950 [Penicillium atrosanguineum]